MNKTDSNTLTVSRREFWFFIILSSYVLVSHGHTYHQIVYVMHIDSACANAVDGSTNSNIIIILKKGCKNVDIHEVHFFNSVISMWINQLSMDFQKSEKSAKIWSNLILPSQWKFNDTNWLTQLKVMGVRNSVLIYMKMRMSHTHNSIHENQ